MTLNSEIENEHLETVDIFCRIRPIFNKREQLTEYKIEQDFEQSMLSFRRHKKVEGGYVNNTRETFHFKFNGLFDTAAKQPEVFDRVAKKCILSAMDGYNSTVFCYGQTGSGKTWTMTGGSEHYEERGIIPRAISLLYEEIERRKDVEYSISITYMEIYNDQGYDLLSNEREVTDIKDLPKINVREDASGNLLLTNVICKHSKTEDDALDMLFIGDNNKTMSETAMNEASSRSHCIFTFNIESKVPKSSRVKVSKLHLVDLAGSERVYKTDTLGTTLVEAKYINQSLHYLELVIVALSENKSHVPYRNSLMTTVLRDSIGGNCKTVMIATINPSLSQFEETISTCRFAQRVASVRQHAVQNEKIDPQTLIRKMKREIAELKEELAFYQTDKNILAPLEPHERQLIRSRIMDFIDDTEDDAVLELGGSHSRIRESFFIFKELFQSFKRDGSITRIDANMGTLPALSAGDVSDEVTELKKQLAEAERKLSRAQSQGPIPDSSKEQIKNLVTAVQMREHEIGILVSMLEKKKPKGKCEIAVQTDHSGDDGRQLSGRDGSDESIEKHEIAQQPEQISGRDIMEEVRRRMNLRHTQRQQRQQSQQSDDTRSSKSVFSSSAFNHEKVAHMVSTLGMVDRAKAFEQFRNSYRKKDVIEKSMESVRTKMMEAKRLAASIEQGRRKIGPLKEKLVQLRTEQTITSLSRNGPVDQSLNEHYRKEEDEVKRQIFLIKEEYMENLDQLKAVKSEIQYLQKGIETHRMKLQRDFDEWYKKTHHHQPSNQVAENGDKHIQELSEPTNASHSSVNVDEENKSSAFNHQHKLHDETGNVQLSSARRERSWNEDEARVKSGAWQMGQDDEGSFSARSSTSTSSSSLSSLLESRRNQRRYDRELHGESSQRHSQVSRQSQSVSELSHTFRSESSGSSLVSSSSHSSTGPSSPPRQVEQSSARSVRETEQKPLPQTPSTTEQSNPYLDKLARYTAMRSRLSKINDASTTSSSLLERSRFVK